MDFFQSIAKVGKKVIKRSVNEGGETGSAKQGVYVVTPSKNQEEYLGEVTWGNIDWRSADIVDTTSEAPKSTSTTESPPVPTLSLNPFEAPEAAVTLPATVQSEEEKPSTQSFKASLESESATEPSTLSAENSSTTTTTESPTTTFAETSTRSSAAESTTQAVTPEKAPDTTQATEQSSTESTTTAAPTTQESTTVTTTSTTAVSTTKSSSEEFSSSESDESRESKEDLLVCLLLV